MRQSRGDISMNFEETIGKTIGKYHWIERLFISAFSDRVNKLGTYYEHRSNTCVP